MQKSQFGSKPRYFLKLILAACIGIASINLATAHEGTHGLANQSGVSEGGDFILDSSTGTVELKRFRGKVVVLYFGYTFCPDACPTTLSALGEAMRGLTAIEAKNVQPLFVTLDPARDDLKRMDEYSHFFYPTMLGLRGNNEKLAKVAKQYGVLYAKKNVDSAANYVVDHSSFLYVIGVDGRLSKSIPYGTRPLEIQAELRAALAPSLK